MATFKQIKNLIKSTVLVVSPTAEIILFGSRARGTNRHDSDWDVLVLLDEAHLTPEHKNIDYELWYKGLDYGVEINTVVRTRKQWNDNVSLFKYNVSSEGIKL